MRIFIETTIPGYLTSRPSRDLRQASHQDITREWWETRRHFHEIYTSQLVLDEAALGDPVRAAARIEILSQIPVLALSETAEALANDILNARILPAEAGADAAHIAVATAHRMDILLTWYCRHIANAANQHALQRLADAHQLLLPVICTPEQLMEAPDENT